MSDNNKHSRLNKFDKRRKNTKYISVLIIIGSILLVILLVIWVFGGKDKEVDNPETTSPDIEINEKEDDENTKDDDTSVSDNEAEETESEEERLEGDVDEEEEIETNPAEPSDGNVVEAYTGNWNPVGTEQEGPHTTDYTDGSQDRIEIQKAAVLATKLNEDDMRTWWVGNGGDQKVIVTVSDSEQTESYRVYLSWIDNQGWQPTKVEVLEKLEY